MANKKITELNNLETPSAADVFVVVDIESDETKKVTLANLKPVIDTIASSNINTVSDNVTAVETRRVANVTEQTAIEARRVANVAVAASNDFVTFTRLQANIDVVQDNVAAITTTLAIKGDSGTDSVTVGGEQLIFKGDTGITTSVGANTVTIDLDDTSVTAGLYGGVSGGVTNVASVTIDATGRVTNAANVSVVTNLDTLQDNINALDTQATANLNTLDANADAIEARRVANVTVMTNEDTALQARITSNVNTLTTNINTLDANADAIEARRVANVTEQTAIEARRVANVTEQTAIEARRDANVTIQTAIEARRVANVTVMTNEDTALQSRLSTNVTALTNTDTAIEARRAANVAGAVSTITTDNLTASRALVSDGSGKVAVSAVTSTELGHLDGVTSAIQTQINAVESRRASNLTGGSSFTGQVNMSDDLVVSGNLVVNGDTTTANSVNLVVQDRIIMLANSVAGAPSADVGLLFNRGNQGNAALFYDESAKTFKLSDTKDPHSNTSLSPVTASNLDVGIITAATVTLDGASVATMISDNVTGAISTASKGNNMTASRALVSDASGKIAPSAVTSTELGHLDGVTSAIQTQLDAKSSTSNAAALAAENVALQSRLSTNVTSFTNEDTALQARITANNTLTSAVETRRAANVAGAVSTITASDLTASRALVSSGSGKVAVSAVTATEIGHLDGVTSAIQTQLNTLTTNINTLDSNADANFTQLNANLNVLDSNADAIETRRVANVTEQTAIEARRVANIAGAVSTITTSDLTASRAMVTNGSGKVAVSSVTSTELGYLDVTTLGTVEASKAVTADSSGDVLFSDNDELKFGDSGDLVIRHNGSHSQIRDLGTGSLKLGGSGIELNNPDNTKNGLVFTVDGSIDLYHNNNKKFETTATGATVTGAVSASSFTSTVATGTAPFTVSSTTKVTNLNADKLDGVNSSAFLRSNQDDTASGNITFNDDVKVKFGTSGDLEIYHDGSDSYITDGGTGNLKIGSSQVEILGTSETMATFEDDGAVELYHDGAKRFETTSTGAKVTGGTGDGTFIIEADTDNSGEEDNALLQLIQDGGAVGVDFGLDLNNKIFMKGTGASGDIEFKHGDETLAILKADGAAELYHDNSKKFETTSSGATVTGELKTTTLEIGGTDVTATATELNHVDGVTSAIQTQIDGLETRRNANVTVAASNNAAVETRRTANIAGAVSTITTSDLTASRALVSSGSGKVAVSAVTSTEIGHLDGVTSAIQTQLNALETRRTNNIAGAISTVLTSDLTASRALVSGSGGKLEVSAVTSTEIGHLDGVTSGIQTQLNGLETRRTNNIAGAISTVLTGNLTTARVLVSDGSGKISVSDITTTELNRLDGIGATISSNTAELAAGIAGTSVGGFSNVDTDFSTLTSANASSTDAFGIAVGGLETFDLLDEPTGSVDTVDCIALS